MLQGGSKILLDNDGASAKVQEDAGFLHLLKCPGINQIFRMRIERRVYGDNIGRGKQSIEVYLMVAILRGASGGRGVDDI